MIRRPPRSPLFPYTTLSDLEHLARHDAIELVPGERLTDDVAAVGIHSPRPGEGHRRDRKSTRLNSSHSQISYAVFCLKKKKKTNTNRGVNNKTMPTKMMIMC